MWITDNEELEDLGEYDEIEFANAATNTLSSTSSTTSTSSSSTINTSSYSTNTLSSTSIDINICNARNFIDLTEIDLNEKFMEEPLRKDIPPKVYT